ncbi:MAG: hypothetical protein PWP23_2507 [Candidatus Sumerlaeota bacterium]|nr:hypothetical protein [Candidatus Sumerlaeota bacterium]
MCQCKYKDTVSPGPVKGFALGLALKKDVSPPTSEGSAGWHLQVEVAVPRPSQTIVSSVLASKRWIFFRFTSKGISASISVLMCGPTRATNGFLPVVMYR